MSASDTSEQMMEATGSSSLKQPTAALRMALGEVAAQLVRAGAGPHHLKAMTWTTSRPEAFHLALREIDLAYREVFVGFRPVINIVQGANENLVITATAAIPPRANEDVVFRDYTLSDLARQYSARSQVADMQTVFRQWSRDGQAFRRGFKTLDIPYGAGPYERLDLYLPTRSTRTGLFVLIHGGYWQAVSKEQNAQFAAGLVKAGFAVANLDYGLAPETPLTESIAQIRNALRFLTTASNHLGVDATDMHLIGHSAGAYYAAMMISDREAPPIRSALLISGIFDLEPIALLPMGRLLGLTDGATTCQLSASNKAQRSRTSVAFALGGKESEEFKRQSHELALAWRTPSPLILKDRNHFDLLDELIDGRLLDVAIALTTLA